MALLSRLKDFSADRLKGAVYVQSFLILHFIFHSSIMEDCDLFLHLFEALDRILVLIEVN